MSGQRITRQGAKSDENLQKEVEAFNPFVSRPKIAESPTITRSAATPTKLAPQELFPENNQQEDQNSQEETSEEQTNMPPTAQTVTLKDAIRVVPEFSGGNDSLQLFLEGCDEALAMLDRESEQNLARFLKAKLTGEARKALAGQTFETVDDLKESLTKIYHAAKTAYQLQGELGNTCQGENEKVISYANRMKEIAQKIVDAYKYEATRTAAELTAYKTQVQTDLVAAFKRGLKIEIEQRLPDSPTIADVVDNALKVERDLLARDSIRRNNQSRREVKTFLICQLCRKEGHEADACSQNLRETNVASFGAIRCEYCAQMGHKTENCPHKIVCLICQAFGHAAAFCPSRNQKNICHWCGKEGHTLNQCFSLKNNQNRPRQVTSMQQNGEACQICNKFGHVALECPQRKNSTEEKAKQDRNRLICQICNMNGHTGATCRWRSNDEALKKLCNFCNIRGHSDNECRRNTNNQGNGQASSAQNGQKNRPLQVRSIEEIPISDLSGFLRLD